MNPVRQSLAAGLYFVGVPIGSARDITLRSLDVLASADVLAAEDTRSLRKLMEIHGVALQGRKIAALHDHSNPAAVSRLVEHVKAGKSVAYASEAGMPLIADPGFELGRAVADAGGLVTCAPGPSAVLTALAIGGLPTDAFHFAGFLPSAKAARRKALAALGSLTATLVLYESPRRVAACLQDAAEVLGDRNARLCRELTKKFEEVRRGTLGELARSARDTPPKGEIVLLIDRAERLEDVSETLVEQMLVSAMTSLHLKDAVAHVTEATGWKRRDVYQLALSLKSSADGD